MKFRLTDNHPTVQALEQVFQLMTDLNIEIDHCYGAWIIKHNNRQYVIEDLENGPTGVGCIPNGLEIKLTYEKPDKE